MLVKSNGFILSAAATAKAMGFGSTDALRFARAGGRLPIKMFLVEGRRGWFAAAEDVAKWLDETTVASRKNASRKAKNTKQKATAE